MSKRKPNREPTSTDHGLEDDPNLSRRGAVIRILQIGAGVAGAAILTSGAAPQEAEARAPRRRGRRPSPPVETSELVSLELVSPRGPGFAHFTNGDERWIAGREGERYNLRLQNRSSARIEVVVTVDGRDVISGEPGDFLEQRGYVLDPREVLTIEGYRQSLDAVAAFRFTDLADSYTARMGTPQLAGVIGVAAFRERGHRPPRRRPLAPVEPTPFPARESEAPAASSGKAESGKVERSAARPAGGRDGGRSGAMGRSESLDWAAPADIGNELGTEYGERMYAPVQEVSFKRKRRHPDQLVVVRYDSLAGLQARGIAPAAPIEPPRPEPQPWRRPSWDWEPEPARDFAPPPPPRRRWR